MPNSGFCQKAFRLGAIESRVYAGHVVERLRNPHPARQYRNIGNEAHITHELIALGPRVSAELSQFSLMRGKAGNRVERGGLARTVRTYPLRDSALFYAQIHAVQGDRF